MNVYILYCERVSVKISVRKVDLFSVVIEGFFYGIFKFIIFSKEMNIVLR